MASLNHNFCLSERRIFLPATLDTLSGVLPVVQKKTQCAQSRVHSLKGADRPSPPCRARVGKPGGAPPAGSASSAVTNLIALQPSFRSSASPHPEHRPLDPSAFDRVRSTTPTRMSRPYCRRHPLSPRLQAPHKRQSRQRGRSASAHARANSSGIVVRRDGGGNRRRSEHAP